MSISFELVDSLSDSEPDELDVSSLSCFAFDVAFNVCFCLLSGSGEVERLELLSLSDEDEAAIAARYNVKTVAMGVRVAIGLRESTAKGPIKR